MAIKTKEGLIAASKGKRERELHVCGYTVVPSRHRAVHNCIVIKN